MSKLGRTLLGGFLMGTADLVPGVSGGTIALVIGIYERLVASIRSGSSSLGSLLSGNWGGFRRHLSRVEWTFLIPLLAGVLLAVVVLSGVLERQLEERPTILAGLFLGLVLGSVVVAWRLIRAQSLSHVLVAVLVGAALFLVLGLGSARAGGPASLPAFLAAGALAICAMILPGISGSLILVLVGMYQPVLGAVNDRDLLTIAVFVVGAVAGLALFSQILYWGLRRHHDLLMAALVGLMAGSTRILWPWPDGVDGPELAPPAGDWPVVVLTFVVGWLAVGAISRLAETREAQVIEKKPSGSGHR